MYTLTIEQTTTFLVNETKSWFKQSVMNSSSSLTNLLQAYMTKEHEKNCY